MEILALSDSLRAASLNSALLRAFARLAPAEISIRQFDGMAHLPLFNLETAVDRLISYGKPDGY